MVFVELPAFTQQQLFDDDELRVIQTQLLADPDVYHGRFVIWFTRIPRIAFRI